MNSTPAPVAGTVPQPLADSPETAGTDSRSPGASTRTTLLTRDARDRLQRQSHLATTRRRSMAIIARFDYAPFDESDPDDFRPNSRWAMLVDPGGDSGAQVNDITLIIEEIAPGDRIPLHTHPINEVVVIVEGTRRSRSATRRERSSPARSSSSPQAFRTAHGTRPRGRPAFTRCSRRSESASNTSSATRRPEPKPTLPSLPSRSMCARLPTRDLLNGPGRGACTPACPA